MADEAVRLLAEYRASLAAARLGGSTDRLQLHLARNFVTPGRYHWKVLEQVAAYKLRHHQNGGLSLYSLVLAPMQAYILAAGEADHSDSDSPPPVPCGVEQVRGAADRGHTCVPADDGRPHAGTTCMQLCGAWPSACPSPCPPHPQPRQQWMCGQGRRKGMFMLKGSGPGLGRQRWQGASPGSC